MPTRTDPVSGVVLQTTVHGLTYIGPEAIDIETAAGLAELGATWRDPTTGRIVVLVRAGLPAPLGRRVLLHEFIHAVDEVFGLGLSERAVRALEVGLSVPLDSVLDAQLVDCPMPAGAPEVDNGSPQGTAG